MIYSLQTNFSHIKQPICYIRSSSVANFPTYQNFWRKPLSFNMCILVTKDLNFYQGYCNLLLMNGKSTDKQYFGFDVLILNPDADMLKEAQEQAANYGATNITLLQKI